MKWFTASCTTLAFISAGMIGYSWHVEQQLASGTVPMAPAPVTSVEPLTAPPAPSASPEATHRATYTPVPIMTDIDSTPVHVQIGAGSCAEGQVTALICAAIVPVQLTGKGELNPPRGKVGWYGPPDWSTVPGNLSGYPGVLAGHVSYSGEPDVFYRLRDARKGDLVILTYANGQTATFVLDADPVSVGKRDVVDRSGADPYKWVWQLDQPGRVLSLFTCDPSQGRDLTGHSFNNWVVQATRIE